MIKRPLIWVLGAFLSGLLLSWFQLPFLVITFLAIIGCIALYLLLYKIRNKYINRRDGFLCCMPFLLLLGFFCMEDRIRVPELDSYFDLEADGTLSGEVTKIVKKDWGRVIYVKDNLVTLTGEKPFPVEHMIVNCTDEQNYLIGNKIAVIGKISKFLEPTNPGQFNEQWHYKIQDISYRMKADHILITNHRYSKYHLLLNLMKQKFQAIYQTILPKKQSGTIIAMLLGGKEFLDDEIRELYSENGISHILAISGLHISLLGISVYYLFKKCKISLILATVLSILFVISYGVFTDFSVSTNRAVVMFVLLLLAGILGKTYDMPSAIALSAFLILLQNPLQLFSVGFLLSFGAVLGIVVIFPSLKMLFQTKQKRLDGLLASVSVQIFTLPILMMTFYQIPSYSVVINLLILPCLTLLILSSLIAGIVGVFSSKLGVFLIGGSSYILKLYEWICRVGSRLPLNQYTTGKPDYMRILLYLVCVSFFVWGCRKYKKKRMLMVLAASILLLIVPEKNPGLEVTMLDVGQGDGIVLETDHNTTYLIDGGSSDVGRVGTYRITPFLLSKGIDHIDYAIITHADQDHISGLQELMAGNKIEIKNLVIPDIISIGEDPHKSLIDLAYQNEITVYYMKAGDQIEDGKLKLTCLHPPNGYRNTSRNAYSTVLSLSYGEFNMLLTGDLEQEGEQLVLEQLYAAVTQNDPKYAVDYDVLKVAHHGSRNSTSKEFLYIVKPEYSLISCGKNNRYGHPHEELLERLDGIGSEVILTYESGAITIKTDGKRMMVEEYVTKGRGN